MSHHQDVSRALRSTSGRAALLLALIGLAVTVLIVSVHAAGGARPARAPHTRQEAAPKNGQHGISQRIAACQRSGKRICDPAAATARRFPLSKPDLRGARKSSGKASATGTTLLTEQQVLSMLGWSSAPANAVGASLMTYGQAQSLAPGLAAESSTVVDPSREVWVVTRYYSTPVTVHGLDVPPGANDTMQVTSASVVIDAATGTVTDSCDNCAVIPATQ